MKIRSSARIKFVGGDVVYFRLVCKASDERVKEKECVCVCVCVYIYILNVITAISK